MTWDLSKLYKGFDDEKFTGDLSAIDGMYASLTARAEKLGGPKDLNDLIGDLCDACAVESRLSLFVQLNMAADANNEDAARLMEKLLMVNIGFTKLVSVLSRFMADKDIDEYAAYSPLMKEHEYMLRLLKRDASHVIEPALEDTVLRLQLTGGAAFSTLRDQLDAGHMIEINGEKMPLSAVRGLAYSADAKVRREAYEAEIAAYPAIETPMAACLNSIKGEALTMIKLRHYDSVLDTALDAARMDKPTLDALLAAMYESLPQFRRFFRAKAEKLGYKGGLKFYDLFAPIGTSVKEYTLEEARALLNEVFTKFSKKMADFIDFAFEDRWIDAYPRKGKVGGAFCAGAHPIGKSYVLANFDGSLASVGTFAHELGHAYHNDCVKHHSILMSDYPMPLAETASIFNETMLVNKLIETSDSETQITLLDQQITDAAQVIVDILSRYIFESEVVARRADHVLTPSELCDIMLDAQQKTYGDGLDKDCMHKYMWACKSHYYSTGIHFYNFPYAFGLLFGLGVFAMYQQKGEAFLPDYDKLLEATSSGDVREVAMSVGIDVTDVNFWRNSIKVITDRIDEFVKM